MNKSASALLKYLLLLSVGLLLLWLTFRNENLIDIWGKIKDAKLSWVLLTIVFSLLALWSRAVRWVMMIEPMGYKPKKSSTFYALLIGYFANLAIPRIGEVSRCASLNKSENVPFNSLLGTVIVERVIDLLMLLMAMFLVAVIEFRLLYDFLIDKVVHPLSETLGARIQSGSFILMLTVCFASLIFIGFFLIYKKESKIQIRLTNMLKEIAQGLASISKMKKPGVFIFHTVFIWLMYFLMAWVSFFSLEATSALDMHAGLFILVAGGLGMSAPVQGGIGAYHYIVSQGLLLFGISPTDGIAYATLVHSTQTLLMIALGLFALLMLFLRNKKQGANG